MNSNLTDLTIIVDRSGSMSNMQQEAENGVNQFIENQRRSSGECNFSLAQFDTVYELVYDNIPIQDVGRYSLVPGGMTSLLDAVGKTINTIGNRLVEIPPEKRPGLVIVVIVTDGAENASQEFNREQIRNMIELQQNTYNWQFTFLGANQDAFAEAIQLGIDLGGVSNYTVNCAGQMFNAASNNVTRMRSAAASGQQVVSGYTDEERDAMQQ